MLLCRMGSRLDIHVPDQVPMQSCMGECIAIQVFGQVFVPMPVCLAARASIHGPIHSCPNAGFSWLLFSALFLWLFCFDGCLTATQGSRRTLCKAMESDSTRVAPTEVQVRIALVTLWSHAVLHGTFVCFYFAPMLFAWEFGQRYLGLARFPCPCRLTWEAFAWHTRFTTEFGHVTIYSL